MQGYDKDQRFSKEIKAAREEFDIEHGNTEPWSGEISEPVGTFVIKSGRVRAYDYVAGRSWLELEGIGEINGESVTVARVI